MKLLYLLRHAKSSWDDAALDDFERPLNNRGRRAARRMGRYLREAGIEPALVLCSAARRTRETCELVTARIPAEAVCVERLLYEADSARLLARLRRLDDLATSVLVIGHNPGLEQFALALAGPGGNAQALERLQHKFPTGALAAFVVPVETWPALTFGAGRLESVVRPADLDEAE